MKMFNILLLTTYFPLCLTAGCCDDKNCCAGCCANQDYCLVSCAPGSGCCCNCNDCCQDSCASGDNCCCNGEDCCSNKEVSSVEPKSDEKNPIQEIASNAVFEQIIKDHPVVVVDFHATWCSPCCQQDPILHAVAEKYQNVYFVKLDIDEDENRTLSNVYGIERIPTLLFFKNGIIKKCTTGIQQETQFKTILDDLLK